MDVARVRVRVRGLLLLFALDTVPAAAREDDQAARFAQRGEARQDVRFGLHAVHRVQHRVADHDVEAAAGFQIVAQRRHIVLGLRGAEVQPLPQKELHAGDVHCGKSFTNPSHSPEPLHIVHLAGPKVQDAGGFGQAVAGQVPQPGQQQMLIRAALALRVAVLSQFAGLLRAQAHHLGQALGVGRARQVLVGEAAIVSPEVALHQRPLFAGKHIDQAGVGALRSSIKRTLENAGVPLIAIDGKASAVDENDLARFLAHRPANYKLGGPPGSKNKPREIQPDAAVNAWVCQEAKDNVSRKMMPT